MADLLARVAATQKTFAKYRTKAFAWDGATCIHLLRAHMVNMGHKPPALPRFKTATGAVRAMERAGFSGLSDILDGQGLERIAPARMSVGDVALLPGDEHFEALVICAGGKLLGWHSDAPEGSGLVVIANALGQATGAWRL